MNDKQFLVGDWSDGDNHCPISQCQLTDAEYASEVGEDFDERVYAEYGVDEGLISEVKAKDIWKRMITYYDDVSHQDDSDFCKAYKKRLELAQKVATQLDW